MNAIFSYIPINKFRFIILFVFIALTNTLYSQRENNTGLENYFSYQAILRDKDGFVVANKDIKVDVYIYHKTEGSVPVYKENHSIVTNAYGLIDIEIGKGNGEGKLNDIDWSDGPYFLEIIVDGGVLGFNKILSVPIANYAGVAKTFLQGDYYALDNIPDLKSFITKANITEMIGGIPTSTYAPIDAKIGQIYYNSIDNKVYSFNGTGWKILAAGDNELFGTIFSDMLNNDNSAGGYKITNIGTPVDNQDAVNKDYVDTKIKFSGSATFSADKHPLNPTLGYVYMNTTDNRLYYWNGQEWLPIGASAVSLESMLTTNPSAGRKNITDVKDPVEDFDGATKLYVDKKIREHIGSVGSGSTLPSSGKHGEIFLNLSDNLLYHYNGAQWVSINISSNTLKNILDNNPAAGSQTITNLGKPTSNNDAVTKIYIDNKVEERKKDIFVGTNPSSETSGEIYFNTSDAMLYYFNGLNWLPLKSNTIQLQEILEINNSAGENTIVNLGEPTEDNDAATKKFVDGKVVEASGAIQTGSTVPLTGLPGSMFYHLGEDKLYYRNNSSWQPIQPNSAKTLGNTLKLNNSAGYNKIINVPDVTSVSQSSDVVNRKYVIEQLSPPVGNPIVKQHSFTISFDGNWNRETVPLWRTPRDKSISIKEISIYAIGTLTPSLNFSIEKRPYNMLGQSGTSLFNEKKAIMSGTDIIESEFENGVNNNIAPKTHIVFVTPDNANVSGLVDCVTVIILYTEI